MTRYILEGEWLGYRSGQERIVHRELIDEKRAGRMLCRDGLKAIRFTDGTRLQLTVRARQGREHVNPITGYTGLIREAEAHGGCVVQVSDLASARRAS